MSGPTHTAIAPVKLKYKHAIMLAKMVQPYIRQVTQIRQESEDPREVGIQLFETLLVQATEDVTELLASMMDCDRSEVEELELEQLVVWFEATWEHNNVMGFIERVRGLLSKASNSQLQNLSNASTVGQTTNSKR